MVHGREQKVSSFPGSTLSLISVSFSRSVLNPLTVLSSALSCLLFYRFPFIPRLMPFLQESEPIHRVSVFFDLVYLTRCVQVLSMTTRLTVKARVYCNSHPMKNEFRSLLIRGPAGLVILYIYIRKRKNRTAAIVTTNHGPKKLPLSVIIEKQRCPPTCRANYPRVGTAVIP